MVLFCMTVKMASMPATLLFLVLIEFLQAVSEDKDAVHLQTLPSAILSEDIEQLGVPRTIVAACNSCKRYNSDGSCYVTDCNDGADDMCWSITKPATLYTTCQ
eukprot:TRINITY_DN27812_c0_g1_i2.p1 TRINITY_DN27812_c0_g1~~TRINITY_DN27812_c0_g1_i2.p1  ORF type:complete len:111 (+),score=12.03 TRINITY_DN27812_c0_g1_i2:26-334(+)